MRRMSAAANVVMANTIFIKFRDSEVYEGNFLLCGYMRLILVE